MKRFRVKLRVVDQERGKILKDPDLTSQVDVDPQDRGHLGLPNRHPRGHCHSAPVKHVERCMVEYAIKP